ncbi:hypothetical protein G6N05_14480 [Flavobacterium sp. F372]|uniref:BZIP transcription factor n=1 Tax=Flavobacterium bernardetii TaxID=2813823 RepID=A0ABR7J2R8_9FLAO|nr:hypothetical protein [Flavobacterium bernardetii]MBC5836134.1 hypothetical protein [Flavobacterium bernardetii]NHF71319.1 hypothetical protein [Flavobacterium bernardetii]
MKNFKTTCATLIIALSVSEVSAQQITGTSLFSPNAGGSRILAASGNTAANPAIGFQGSTLGGNDVNGGNGIFRPLANTMSFATFSTERMRIAANGQIGIGLISPTATLDVANDFRVTSTTMAGRNYRINSGSRQEVTATNDLVTFTGQNNGLILNATGGSNGTFFIRNLSETNPTLFQVNGANGRVGIGTASPSALLDVSGASNPNLKLTSGTASLEVGISSCNGCFDGFSKPNDAVIRTLGGGDLLFNIPGTNENRKIAFHTAGDKILTIQEVGTSGKVGVGTTNFPTLIGSSDISAYKLFVKGGILTDEVRVRTGWADYVFADNYVLKPLAEVERFIETNKHLPNVPSAKQVELEGISIGEMTKIQQEKIEELTLYIIDLNKKLALLEAKLTTK